MSTAATVKPSLTMKRRFNASPEKLQRLDRPEKSKRWMGPGEVKPLLVETDPRTGGRYRWLMQAPAASSTMSAASRDSCRTKSWCSPGAGNQRRSASRW